jgi:nitrogen fixation protein FixH
MSQEVNPSGSKPVVTEAQERRARRFWVSLIVGFLGLEVVSGVFAIYLATSDPSVAVIPNYYQAGLDWDVKRRNLDHLKLLGWTTEVLVEPEDVELGQRFVVIQVRSKTGAPVNGLRISARIFHHARGTEVHRLVFDETADGDYIAISKLTQPGLWQVDLVLEGDHGIAEDSLVVDVSTEKLAEMKG